MQDRYIIRSTSISGRWYVWDMHADAVVFGGEDLSQVEARAMARRLNDAYRRSVRDEWLFHLYGEMEQSRRSKRGKP